MIAEVNMLDVIYTYLAWPWAFLLLPLPFIAQKLLSPQRHQMHQALHVPFFNKIQTLSASTHINQHYQKPLLWLMWFFIIIALSGPQWMAEPIAQQKAGRNIMLALDLSGSMEQLDMQINQRPVTRLAVVKLAATDFVSKRVGDRLGLVLFGTNAYLQTPLTFDRKTVQHMINDATIGLAGQTTSIGDAIALSIKRLKNTPPKSRVLVLLTDGSNNSGNLEPLKAAKIAKKYGIKIYTIGLGADQQIMNGIFGPQIYNPSQDLDVTLLKKISKLTGGQYFRAKDPKQLNNVYNEINTLEPVANDSEQFRPVHPYYYIPLSAAFICLILLEILPFLIKLFQWQPRKRHA